MSIQAAKFRQYASDPKEFRRDLLIDADGTPKPFGKALKDNAWQQADFDAIDKGMLVCAGRSKSAATMNHWLERGRGHSKTHDVSVLVCWALLYASRPLKGYVFSADKDQSRLLIQSVETLIRLNEQIGQLLKVERNRVVNKAEGHPAYGGFVQCESSDVGSSFGILPDLVVAEEVHAWPGDGGLWYSTRTSAAKRSTCLFIAITNAPFADDSWIWKARENARTDPEWHFSRLDGPKASWIDDKRLEQLRRSLPAVAFNRLILNIPGPASGGDALLPEDIEACFFDDLQPLTSARERHGLTLCGGLDLGLKRDASCFIVLGTEQGAAGRVRLVHAKLWSPKCGKKVDLMEVEAHIIRIDDQLGGLEGIAYDPWQSDLLASRISTDMNRHHKRSRRRYAQLPYMREVPPTASNLRDVASLTLESFQDHNLQLYHWPPLKKDLLKLRVEERPNTNTYRLVSPRDSDGHGDAASAFTMALWLCADLATKRPMHVGSALKQNSPMSALQAWERRRQQLQAEYDAVAAMGDGRNDLPVGLARALLNRRY